MNEQGYKIQAYVRDHMPPHVHVWKDGRYASFIVWNGRVRLHDNRGLKESQVKAAAELCAKHYDKIVSTLKEMPWVR